ncbi:MAG: NADPH-dependent FMN reductase [bacterium]
MPQKEKKDSSVVVVGLPGSLRPGSHTRMAVDIALQGAREVGAITHLVDLSEYTLSFCDGREDESTYPADVMKLRELVGQAHGIILGTPEYHGSFSGVLKNALDLMGFDEFQGKMLGLIGVSGGALGATNALSNLRMVGRALHAWLVPEQASIPEAWKVFDAAGNLKDEKLQQRLQEVGRQVARFAYLHTSRAAQDFLKTWEGAPMNPGG